MYAFRIEVFRCPFCTAPGRGVVSADPARIPTEEEPPPVGSPASYLWFSPGAADPDPCPHVLYFDAEVERTAGATDGPASELGYDCVRYYHPALQAADPRHALLDRLCEALSADPTAAPRPDIPFELQRKFVAGEVIGPVGRPGGAWSLSVDGGFAADVPRFVRECVALSYGAPRPV